MQTPLGAIRHLTDAWMRKNASEMSRWLTGDIVEIGPAFIGALEGKESFFRKYETYMLGPCEICSYEILRPKTIWLGVRRALVYFHYRMRTRQDGRIEESRGKESMLVEKICKNWRVKFIHWHQDPPC